MPKTESLVPDFALYPNRLTYTRPCEEPDSSRTAPPRKKSESGPTFRQFCPPSPLRHTPLVSKVPLVATSPAYSTSGSYLAIITSVTAPAWNGVTFVQFNPPSLDW